MPRPFAQRAARPVTAARAPIEVHNHTGGAGRVILTPVLEIHYNQTWPAEKWADENPAGMWELIPCCIGATYHPRRCTCWVAVYAVEQAEPAPVLRPELLLAQTRMCGDCAYRKGSIERSSEYTEEEIFTLARKGEAFWCHEGMRRPVYWQHPDGRTIAGSPDDWHPAKLGNFLYQADGSPALLCAGWIWRRMQALKDGAPAAPLDGAVPTDCSPPEQA